MARVIPIVPERGSAANRHPLPREGGRGEGSAPASGSPKGTSCGAPSQGGGSQQAASAASLGHPLPREGGWGEGTIPLSLYIHFPWCVRKCPYCDFNSHEARASIPEADYLAALIDDLEAALPQVWGRRVASVFIGGGTPSLLSAAGVDALLAAVRARLTLVPGAEITLEANPGAIEAEKFASFRDAGVNRISLGIQSFDNRRLAALGRIHTGDEARRAIESALEAFDNLNLDLMYALPNQGLEDARSDLEAALSFAPPHLSAYQLTLEPNTPFHHAPPSLPDDELAADMQEMIEETLASAGYQHYETSAFALPGARCAHNLNYWNFGDYLGIGAGAHGKLSSHQGIVREARRRGPRDYLQGDFLQERRAVAAGDLPFEFMMNALRLTEGFPIRLFEERTGLPLAVAAEAIDQARRQGLLAVDELRVAPTLRGQRCLNELLQLFL